MKKTMSFKLLSILVCSALGSQLALAADAGRFYVGADIVTTEFSGDGIAKDSLFVPNQRFEDSDGGYGLHAGFQFNNWFAAEVSYTDFGSATDRFKIKPDIVFIVAPNDTQTLDAKGISLSSVFSYHPSERFSVLGVLGISSLNYENTVSGGFSEVAGNMSVTKSLSEQGLLYGVGAKYALSDSIALRADVRRHEVGDFKLDSASLGLEYSF